MRSLRIQKQITHRDEVSIDKYLHEMSKERLLTPEQEVELGKEDQEKMTKKLN